MEEEDIYKLDFIIQSKPLTAQQQKELSEFIAKRKLEIEKKLDKKVQIQYTQ